MALMLLEANATVTIAHSRSQDLRALTQAADIVVRSEEHTSELQSLTNLVCRLLLEKKKNKTITNFHSR